MRPSMGAAPNRREGMPEMQKRFLGSAKDKAAKAKTVTLREACKMASWIHDETEAAIKADQAREIERVLMFDSKEKKEMNRTWKYYVRWALSVLLIAVGIYCAYMAYSLRADAAQKPKPAPISCVPLAAKAIPADKAAWKAERAAKITAAGAKAPMAKTERAKVKR